MVTLGAAVAVTCLHTKDISGDVGVPPAFGWMWSLPRVPGLLGVILLCHGDARMDRARPTSSARPSKAD
jgi:hypothetical protein